MLNLKRKDLKKSTSGNGSELRFGFGNNWKHFLGVLNEERIAESIRSLQQMLGVESLAGKSFLDAGSGSGLSSLAARRLGARVYSFDYDEESVACTNELRNRFFQDDAQWEVSQGSVLDPDYLAELGQFDVVYSWGVLHHTGDMQKAFENITKCVAPTGQLYIAIYNDQGPISRYWLWVKRHYNRGASWRVPLTAMHMPYLLGARYAIRAASGRLGQERGMSLWYDMKDWLGGYPFEVARPEQVFDFFSARGLCLKSIKTCGGRQGCNEFVFTRTNEEAP